MKEKMAKPYLEKVYVQKVKLFVARESTSDKKINLSRPESIAGLQLIKDELVRSDREKFLCLHLDTKNNLISYEVVSVGSLNSSIVHPRELYKGAILSNASSVILCHNHPSGDPKPSQEDIRLSKRLKEAGKLLGVYFLDHIIIAEDKFVSFNQKGLL